MFCFHRNSTFFVEMTSLHERLLRSTHGGEGEVQVGHQWRRGHCVQILKHFLCNNWYDQALLKYYCIACVIQFVFAFLCLCYQKFGQEYRPLAESPLEKVPHLPHLFSILVSTLSIHLTRSLTTWPPVKTSIGLLWMSTWFFKSLNRI